MADGIVEVRSGRGGDMVLAYKLIKLEGGPKEQAYALGDWCHIDSVPSYRPHLGEKPPKTPALINLRDVIDRLPTGSTIEILVPDDH